MPATHRARSWLICSFSAGRRRFGKRWDEPFHADLAQAIVAHHRTAGGREARNVILAEREIKQILDAAYKQGETFGLLVEVAALTGSRYGQIANLVIGDLQDGRDEPRLMMPSSKKGKGRKKVLRRPVPIPVSLAKKLREAAGNRPADAPLLVKPSGDSWHKSDHSRLFHRAVVAAFSKKGDDSVETKEVAEDAPRADIKDGEKITIYALRHSSIVRQILRGVPVRVVAVVHDTSVAMIEKNYSKFQADHSDGLARAALPNFDEIEPVNPEGN